MTGARTAAIFGVGGTSLTADEGAFFRATRPLGFILFARNIAPPDQVRWLVDELREATTSDVLILIDQEGGRVQRLRAPTWREWRPALDLVEGFDDIATAARAMQLRMSIIALELRALGIDTNCAPLADIAGAATHPFLRNRCYGTDAEMVTRIARAAADGLLAGGVLPVLKHIPGHGRAQQDSHEAPPLVTADRDTLFRTDFAPFHALRDLPMAMTAHVVYAALDPDRTATQSPAVIRAIRSDIGFDGLLLSDDLNMQALAGTLAERTATSMAAGCDIALHCSGVLEEMVEVAPAAGAMTPAATLRATRAFAAREVARSGARDLDMHELVAEFTALAGPAGTP